MQYRNICYGSFVDRPNRFIAHVTLDGKTETVHVKNTGRCKELLLPGVRVVLEKADNPNRKTRYDLIAVEKAGLGWVNIDSQVPNTVVAEWLKSGHTPFEPVTKMKPEAPFGASRIDFYIESGEEKILLEVKGCTLEREGVGFFPDAPTARGVKHLKELAAARDKGYRSAVAFVIAMPKVETVLPNRETDPAFAKALEEAKQAGVEVLMLRTEVLPDSIRIL